MKTAEGIGAWHNQYNNRSREECVERAKRARLDFVIVKYGLPEAERVYAAAGIPWATEVYAYIHRALDEGNRLANAVDAGACFAVINAEEGGEWGPKAGTGWAMTRLIDTFRARHPHVGLYACLDTRGDRLSHPYQQVALERCDGIMPMIYPGAFYPSRYGGYIARAFSDALDDKDFRGKPVYPVLQAYGESLGPTGIKEQLDCAMARRADGCSFYTIHHATDAEWDAVCKLRPEPKPESDACREKLIVAEKFLLELSLRVDAAMLVADGRWPELHAKLHARGIGLE